MRSQSGSDGRRFLRLTEEPIDDALVAQMRAEIASEADGAVVVFLGQTRVSPGTPAPGQEAVAAQHAGKDVVGLEYEVYEAMALDIFGQIADEAQAGFGVERVAIVHRVGTVLVGEPSVAIVVAAPHRGAAFGACSFAIDELKARAPIWKSEQFKDGSVWIGAPARTGPRGATA